MAGDVHEYFLPLLLSGSNTVFQVAVAGEAVRKVNLGAIVRLPVGAGNDEKAFSMTPSLYSFNDGS